MDDTFPTRRVLGRHWPGGPGPMLVGPRGVLAVHRDDGAVFLSKIRESPDPNIRYLAYAKLASPQCYDDAGPEGRGRPDPDREARRGRRSRSRPAP